MLFDDLSNNDKVFNKRTSYYYIIKYINDFLEGKNINRYLVLPGIRDTGKSTILFQIYQYLLNEKNINQNNILYLSGDNLKQMCNSSIIEAVDSYLDIFHNVTLETLNQKVFLLIDESQYDKNWAITGKIIFDSSKNIFMIFTGSSALELSYNADSARRLLRIPITPLTYYEHLILKYGYFKNNMSKSIFELIFDGRVDQNLQKNMFENYSKLKNFNINEWKNFLKFGGFPSYFYQTHHDLIKKLTDTINRVITVDINNIGDLSSRSQDIAFQILYYFALQNPGEISKESMSNTLDTTKPTLNKILDILEKTQLIFHIDPFVSSAKRITKPKKYYFATSSLKNVLSTNIGGAILENEEAYMGKLLENFVASNFFNLENDKIGLYKTYYDLSKKSKKGKTKKNVDFLVQRGIEPPIPIEVSYGKKDNNQIKKGISKYNSSHGIIISNTKSTIEKEDNIIYLPPEVFAFI